MRANRRRQFTAPRLLKEPERTRQSESDEDDIPFSELKEKVVSERQGSDSEGDDISFSQMQTRTTSIEESASTVDSAHVATTTEPHEDTHTEEVMNPECM